MTGIDAPTTTREVRELRTRVRDLLAREYLRLRTVDRPALLEMLPAGDVAAGPEAEIHQRGLDLLDRRIADVHDYLCDLHEVHPGDRPGVDCCVEVDLGAGPRWMLLASLPVEDDDVIVADSPLGRALLAGGPGETVTYSSPDGAHAARLVAVEAAPAPWVAPSAGGTDDASTPSRGALSELDRAAAMRLLEDVHVGSLAFCMLGAPHVEVVNFVLDNGEPVFRIGSSTKLAAVGRGHPFALHVNRVEEPTRSGWSVTVTGDVRLIRGEEAEQLAGTLVPWAGGRRPYVVKMEVHRVTGRLLAPAVAPA